MNRRKLLWEKFRGRADMRPILKSGTVSFLIVLLVGLALKLFVIDAVKVSGVQMEPAIMAGDRVLLFKTPHIIPLVRKPFATHGKPVVAELPDTNAVTLLRIAATSGDIISVDKGQFYRNGQPVAQHHKDTAAFNIILGEYSPSDFMAPLKLPERGDSITFAGLEMRDLIFAYSILRQEKEHIRIKPSIVKGGDTLDNYEINDFALYHGPLNEIPERLSADWFFWDRLLEYIDIKLSDEDNSASFAFSLFKHEQELTGFRVKKKYVFLLGDNWIDATDSRYFGPIAVNRIQSHAFMTLWGYTTGEDGRKRVDWDRVFRKVK